MATNPRADEPLIPPRPTRVAAAETPKASIAPSILVAGLIVTGLYVGREVLIPIAIAVLLSFVIGPLVNLLRRLRLGRLVAVTVSVLLTFGIVGALATLIGVQLADLAGDVPRYRYTIERKVESVREGTLGQFTGYVANVGQAIRQANNAEDKAKEAGIAGAGPAADAEDAPAKPLIVEMKDREPTPLELASTLLSPTLQPLATAGIVFVVLLFILMQREDLRDRMIRLAGSSDLYRTTVAMDDAARRLSRYFVVQLALNSAFGVVVGIGLYLIGVPNPVLWGIFSALMRFLPYIGAFLSALFPMALAAAVDPGWTMVIATAALFLVLEPLVGHIVEPLVYGQSTGMSPFAVLVAALFWTWLWGPVGLVLSTPITVCLVVLGRHVDRLEFLDVLFGDRPALTPVENFYQRMLADDPEEAQEHADLILRGCSLTDYYDDVVLKGLELAARDAARGVLTQAQKADIRASIAALIEELADREDVAPDGPGEFGEPSALWRQTGAVLCVAGRGFLDEAAAGIVAQLLNRHSIGTRVVPFSEVARARIDTFDPGPARMICITSLAIGGEPAHLHRLVRRLKGRVPNARIAVGLWRADDPVLTDDASRAAIGAHDHVVSLRATIEAVLAAAQGADARQPSEPETV